MPLVKTDNYRSPFWCKNGHIDTIYPALFRRVKLDMDPEAIRLATSDEDYLDLDYYHISSNRTAIISHGLEGNSKRPYMKGMSKVFLDHGWNVISWNYRGCNGEVNNSIRSYHSGFTEDQREVVNFAECQGAQTIALIGFSLGGNITLRHLAERPISTAIRAAVTISVPLDLHSGCVQISKPENIIYSKRFLRTMKKKVREKARIFPEIDVRLLTKARNLQLFDEFYTAPLHGFANALDYYTSCSALFVLDQIEVPTLILNAKNDPFLPPECYPYRMLEHHNYVFLETPAKGGHVGFASPNGADYYWSEKRALQFIQSMI